jgi:hypothetical protein
MGRDAVRVADEIRARKAVGPAPQPAYIDGEASPPRRVSEKTIVDRRLCVPNNQSALAAIGSTGGMMPQP